MKKILVAIALIAMAGIIATSGISIQSVQARHIITGNGGIGGANFSLMEAENALFYIVANGGDANGGDGGQVA